MLTDKNQNSFHPPLHPPTPPIRCSIYEHMFSSLWEQQVWVEPAPVRNRTGERRAEECFPVTGYLPGPGLLIWARAKGGRHRRLLTVGETGAVRSFHYQPIFSLRPPSPSHGGTRVAGSLSPRSSCKGGAGSARQAGFQEKQSSASGSPTSLDRDKRQLFHRQSRYTHMNKSWHFWENEGNESQDTRCWSCLVLSPLVSGDKRNVWSGTLNFKC